MTTTIFVTTEIAQLYPSLTAGTALDFQGAMLARSVTDTVVIEYVLSQSAWRFVDDAAKSEVSTIVDWFAEHSTLTLHSDADGLLAQFNDYIRPTTNMYISSVELIALLLYSADKYILSPDPSSSHDVATYDVVVNNVIDQWLYQENYDAEFGGFVYALDEPGECPLRTSPKEVGVVYDSTGFQHMLGGNSFKVALWAGNTMPIIASNGILVNQDQFSNLVETDYITGDIRNQNFAVNMFSTYNVDQYGNRYGHKLNVYFESVNLNYPDDPGLWTYIRGTSIDLPASSYRYWLIMVQWGGRGYFVPSLHRTLHFENEWQQPTSRPHNYQRTNSVWTKTENVGGVTATFQPHVRAVTTQATRTLSCGSTARQWHGLFQDHSVFTPGVERHWTVVQRRNFLHRAGAVGNENPTEGQLLPLEPYSTAVDNVDYSQSTSAESEVSTFQLTARQLVNIDDLIAVDAFNLPNWHSQAAAYPAIASVFKTIANNGDPYLKFMASITSAYVARAILENLMLSLTVGVEMEPVFGITDNTPIVVVDPSDPDADVLTPAQARNSDDLDLICANYTDFTMRLDDIITLHSALNDAEVSYQSLTEVIDGLLANAADALSSVLYKTVDPYAMRQAALTDGYAAAAGLQEIADVVSSAVAAGAASASDVINFIDVYAPQFSLKLDANASVMFKALMSASAYDGYHDYFTGNDDPVDTEAMSFFTKTGAGMIRADTEGEVFDAKVGAMMLWPPLFSGMVAMPADFVSYFDSVGKDAAFTVPLRHSYIVLRTVTSTTCQMLWCARFSGGGDEAASRALQESAREMASCAQAIMRNLSGDNRLIVTSTGDADLWRVDTESAFDPSTRDLENAITALTYAGAGALAGAALGPYGAAAGALIGGITGVTLTYFTGGEGDADVWDVAAARNLINIDLSSLNIVSSDASFATTSPDVALIRCLAAYAYVVYRGVWAPLSHPDQTPVGYAVVTPSIVTPRYYQMDKWTDVVPMISTLGAALSIAGTTQYFKRTKIGVKNKPVTATFKKTNGKLQAEIDLPRMSFGSVRTRSCLPAVAAGGAYGLVSSAASGVRSAVESRAAKAYDNKLLRAATNADRQSGDLLESVSTAVVPVVANVSDGVSDISSDVSDVTAKLDRVLALLQNPLFWPRP